jgi:hypothetical protein
MKARPKTVATDSVPAAGKEYLGLGTTASHAAADAGDIPTIGRGRNRRAVIPLLRAKLGLPPLPEEPTA